MNIFKEIKYFYQRGTRGWSDRDAWDIDSFLCDLLPPFLRKLKGNHGCPSEFYDKDAINAECHKWNETIEEMAQGFESAAFIQGYGYHKWVESKEKPGHKTLEIDNEALNNAEKKMNRGLELFAKHFLNLWD